MQTPSTQLKRLALPAIGVAAVQLLLVLMFSWPASRGAPHGVPIAVAGPPQASQAFTRGLSHARPGAFTVTVLPDGTAARSAVTAHRAYASVLLGRSGDTIYTAPAAGAAVAQELGTLLKAALQQGRPNETVAVTPLVPGPAMTRTVPACLWR